jgi:CHAT domain-containing protein
LRFWFAIVLAAHTVPVEPLPENGIYAGSSSIVASRWKVDDLATAQLMTRFYKETEMTDKREALRTAQLETKKKYPHPYYWASFQLTGNAK